MEPKEPVEKAVQSYMQTRSESIDAETQKHLDDIRHRVVDMAERQAERHPSTWLRNAGFAGAFGLLLFAGVIAFNTQTDTELNEPSSLELVLLNEDFELMGEDLAFYGWVEGELGERG